MNGVAVLAFVFAIGVVILVAWLNADSAADDREATRTREPVEVAKRALREFTALDGAWVVTESGQWVYAAPRVYAVITYVLGAKPYELELTLRGRTSIHYLAEVEDAMQQVEYAARIEAVAPVGSLLKW